ncbi:helix-turn-helix transcriptional regulator [Spirosoma sp. SC4-14]|uniref:helix-turn-helix domain-containing protein n=1 Tax=Spirosoma sp. SC4-14 TaxID=3128900 RepID=UPI0030CA6DEF
MTQQTLIQRLEKVRERCLKVPGGIKAVAEKMGRSENTLHNWFKGRTTPSVKDIESLVTNLVELEEKGRMAKMAEEQKLNAILP